MPNPDKWHRTPLPFEPFVGATNTTPNFGKSRKSTNLLLIFDLEYNYELLSRKSEFPLKSEAVHRQMHPFPSSRGVGWANGYCGIVITAHTQHVASF